MPTRKRRHYHRKRMPPAISQQPKPPGARRVASIAQACVYAGVSRVTLWRLLNRGTIKAYKFSRRTMVDLDSIDAFHASLPETNHANG